MIRVSSDDHQIVRQGIQQILAHADDIALAGEADRPAMALEPCASGSITMPRASASKRITTRCAARAA
jgi:DNA-binding NarL/FixJ family response regulator